VEPSVIVFNGIPYRRYPHAKTWSDRYYFRASPSARRKGYARLHVDLWKSVHGDVPPGCHIHHKDGNPFNNTIDNLECLAPGDHVRVHRGNPVRRSPEWLAKLDAARELSAAWAGTAEGRETASRRARRVWEGREPTPRTCEQCGKSFLSRYAGRSRFCSGRCDAAWRAARKVYHEWRTCAVCGKDFLARRWRKAAYCSRACGARYRRTHAGGGVQPDGGG
jgi:hypothetical protein